MSLQVVLDRLDELGLVGSPGWNGETAFRCPAHDDDTPSASIRETEDGRVLIHDHAGCTVADIMAALDLPMSELFPEDEPEPRVVAEYVYEDMFGRPIIKVARIEPGPDGKKKVFKQWRRKGESWILGAREVDKPLYRLPEVRAAHTVWLVEGEKDADRLNAYWEGVFRETVATTAIGGAGKRWQPEWTETLAGKEVVICGDNDEPGRKHVAHVKEALGDAPKSITVKWPAQGKDVSDHLDAGLGLDDLIVDRPPSRFLTFTPENATPPPDWVYEPFLLGRSLILLFGPSGHGKSIALDYAVAEMTRRRQRVLYYDWESPELELDRLSAMQPGWDHLRLHGMDPENPGTFGDKWFRDDVRAEVDEFRPDLVVFNTFTAMYGEMAAADSWNAPVREAGQFCRGIARDFGPCVVIIDHQEDPNANHAHGGRSKKAWSELYLRVTSDQTDLYDGNGTYYFKIESLKQSRKQLKTVRARVVGQVEQRNVRIDWDWALPIGRNVGTGENKAQSIPPGGQGGPTAAPVLTTTSESGATRDDPGASQPAPDPGAMTFKERLALQRLKDELGATEVTA